VDDCDQFFSGNSLWTVGRRIIGEHMLAYMVLNHLGDETIERTPACRSLLQYPSAFAIFAHRAFDGRNLPAQPCEAVEKLTLLGIDMAHLEHLSF
jgi:hypothetical protein